MKGQVLERAEKLRDAMEAGAADAFVIIDDETTNWESLYYMSGFRGTSGALVVYKESAELILDGRYIQQGRSQSPHVALEQKNSLTEDVRESLSRHGARSVLCEAEKTYHSTWAKLSADSGMEWRDGTEQMKAIRRTKDYFEIECIRKAAEIGASAFLETLNDVKAGMTEKEFESMLNFNICRSGGGAGFSMIVASGERGAMPHGTASDKKMLEGESVTVDFGARYKGYFCDITRTFSIGEPSERALCLHDAILAAHSAAAKRLRAGVSGASVHKTALDVLNGFGVGQYFTHGLGHGFGLEIHEAPYLSARRDDVLKVGDIVTVEPGAYIEGWGGLRLEDDYLICENGAERLTDELNQCFYHV